jgi:hypothetical protein
VLWAKANGWANGAIALGVVPIAFIFLLSLLVAGVLNLALRDFIAPLQMARNVGAKEAGSVFLSMLSANPGLLIGYVLLKFVGGIAVSLVVLIVCVVTCCVGALPLIHQTLFQPVYYAERAWSLKLLAQMGEDVFPNASPAGHPPPYLGPEDAPTAPIDLSEVDFETPQA